MKAVWTRVLLVAACQLSAAGWLWACPRCVDATPYKIGLFWGVLFLMPLPFLVFGGVIFWIIRHSKGEIPPTGPEFPRNNKQLRRP